MKRAAAAAPLIYLVSSSYRRRASRSIRRAVSRQPSSCTFRAISAFSRLVSFARFCFVMVILLDRDRPREEKRCTFPAKSGLADAGRLLNGKRLPKASYS
jgi:hypothetical protein